MMKYSFTTINAYYPKAIANLFALKGCVALACLVCVFFFTNPADAMSIKEFGAALGGKISYVLKPGQDGLKGILNKLLNTEWVNLEFTVTNSSTEPQFILSKNRQPVFVNNFNSKWIRILPEAVISDQVMQRGQELQPKKGQDFTSYSIGKLQYYYHTQATNVTTVHFWVSTNYPVKTERECVLKFKVKSKGPQLNSYLNVTSDPQNKKYENTCIAYIVEDPDALKQNCGWFWCERPKERDFAKVNIVVMPPKVMMAKLVPPCQQSQTSEFPDTVFIYPNSTDPKEMARTEQPYDIQPLQPICPRGIWTIKLPENFQFKKFQFGFTKPILGHQEEVSSYTVEPSPEITGWPELRDIKHPAFCVYGRDKTCELNIVPVSSNRHHPAPIKTPEGKITTITITNNALFANMIPTFEAWSVTPYRKPK